MCDNQHPPAELELDPNAQDSAQVAPAEVAVPATPSAAGTAAPAAVEPGPMAEAGNVLPADAAAAALAPAAPSEPDLPPPSSHPAILDDFEKHIAAWKAEGDRIIALWRDRLDLPR